MSKKTVQLNVALTPEVAARAAAICKSEGIKPTELCRAGLLVEIARLEAHAAGVTPEEAKALESYRRLTGQDPVKVLAEALKAHLAA